MNPDLQTLFAEARSRIAARDIVANDLCACLVSGVRMQHGRISYLRCAVTPDHHNPDLWRITRLDERGPIGHSCFSNKRAAVVSALEDGYFPERKAQ